MENLFSVGTEYQVRVNRGVIARSRPHRGFAEASQRPHKGLTEASQGLHGGFTETPKEASQRHHGVDLITIKHVT